MPANETALTETRKRMNDAGIEVSLFIAPDPEQIEAAARTGASSSSCTPAPLRRVWLKGGLEASTPPAREDARPASSAELDRLIAGARQAHALGLKVNAGHGLNYQNLPLLHRVPHLVELNIGHSIVSRAVTVGMASAVKEMLRLMKNYRG